MLLCVKRIYFDNKNLLGDQGGWLDSPTVVLVQKKIFREIITRIASRSPPHKQFDMSPFAGKSDNANNPNNSNINKSNKSTRHCTDDAVLCKGWIYLPV